MKQSASSSSSNRLGWVDIYRGLAIILIVVGHTWSPLVEYIYLFHVPAFFFISGITSNFAKYEPASFVWKRLQSLLVPFFTFNLFFIALHLLLKKLSLAPIFYNPGDAASFSSFGAFNGLISFTRTEEIGGATWFLPVLFVAQLLAYWLVRKKYTEKLDTLLLVSAGLLLGARFFFARTWYLAYNLDLALFATFFVLMGTKLGPWLAALRPRVLWPLATLCALIVVLLGKLTFIPLDFPSRTFGSLPLVLASSFSGILALYGLSKLLARLSILEKPLAFLGKNSLWILMFHFLGFKVYHLAAAAVGVLPLTTVQRLIPEPGNSYWIPLSIWGVVFSLLALGTWRALRWSQEQLRPHAKKLVAAAYTSPTVVQATALSALTVLQHAWVLKRDNFFYADDFGYLWLSRVREWSDFLSLVPQQMYNDRPFGQLFIHTLLTIFGFHYRYIHATLLAVHVLNALLLFGLLVRLARRWKIPFTLFPFLGALLFASWPKSTFAVQWLSASFDLVGATLILIFLHAAMTLLYAKSKVALTTLVASFLLMVRTKEVLLLTPLVGAALALGDQKNQQILPFLRRHRWFTAGVLATFILMVLYGLRLVYLAVVSRFMGFEGASPYAVSLNPQTLLTNLFRYFVLYFNVLDSQQVFSALSLRWMLIFLLGCVILLLATWFSRWRKYVFVLLLAAILTLVPVLPLKNMAHKLYLYIPSLFLSSALLLLVHDFTQRLRIRESRLLIMVVGALLWFSFQWGPFRAERTWWQIVGLENRSTYLRVQGLDSASLYNEALILDAPPTSIYGFGPGDILRYHFRRADITTKLIPSLEAPQEATPSSTLILPGRN